MPLFDLPDGASLDGQRPTGGLADLPTGAQLDDQGYTGSVLPFHTSPTGQMSFAVPRIASGLFNTLTSAVTAPGDAYLGRLQTPYTPGATSATATPDTLGRAMDFASVFSPQSVATGAGSTAGSFTKQAIPTTQQLKDAASAGYDAARASTATVPGEAIANMAQGLQQSLQSDHGIIAKTAPKTYALLDELANPPAGASGAYPGLEAARRGLSAIAGEGGTEGYAAQKAIPQLDSFIDSISPEAASARANYAAAMRSNAINGDLSAGNTGIIERAEARAHAANSGLNLDNAIRQRLANFLQNPDNLRGFSSDEIEALNAAVKGGPIQNTARRVSNLLGGGQGMHGGMLGTVGAILGEHIGGPVGAGIGAGIPLVGGGALKSLENGLASRSLSSVDELIRSRSPLADAMQGILAPDMNRNDAVLRSVMPGLLGYYSGPPQSPPIMPSWMQQLYNRGGA